MHTYITSTNKNIIIAHVIQNKNVEDNESFYLSISFYKQLLKFSVFIKIICIQGIQGKQIFQK